MAQANVLAPLRWKRAKIHRGSRRLAAPILGPHQEAGYTSAVVTVAPDHVRVLQSGGVHIRPHMTLHVTKFLQFLQECLGDVQSEISRLRTARLIETPCQAFFVVGCASAAMPTHMLPSTAMIKIAPPVFPL